MKIEVLGSGCVKCQKTADIIKSVLEKKGLHENVEKVTDIKEITKRGIMMTPAVIIDGNIVHEGGLPKVSDIESWF